MGPLASSYMTTVLIVFIKTCWFLTLSDKKALAIISITIGPVSELYNFVMLVSEVLTTFLNQVRSGLVIVVLIPEELPIRIVQSEHSLIIGNLMTSTFETDLDFAGSVMCWKRSRIELPVCPALSVKICCF